MAIILATAGVTPSSACLPRTVHCSRERAQVKRYLLNNIFKHIVINEIGLILVAHFAMMRNYPALVVYEC